MTQGEVPFHATGWQSQKVPTYNMGFVEIGKRKRQIQKIYDEYFEQKAENIRVGLVVGEWGLGKTHLFLHLIKKIFENSKDCLPLYVDFEKDLRPADVLDIEEDDLEDFSNGLYQSAISSVKKYEENLKIPYSTQLPAELLNQIDDLSDKNASEIYAEIRKYYDYVYVFIDELEGLMSEDDENISKFLEMIIKKNVERDLSVKDRVTFILGCTGPIWNAIEARYTKVRPETKGRLLRRKDTFKLEPLTYDEAVELIKEIITKADKYQQNPFTNQMIRTLWRASNGSPPSFLHLYNIVSLDAIRNAKKGENVIIDYNQMRESLLEELIYVGKEQELPAIFKEAYEDIKNILPKSENITEEDINFYHTFLDLMTTSLGEWKKDELLEKSKLDEDTFYKIVNKVNDLSQKRYNQPIFVEVRVSNIHDAGEFQNKLRERFRGIELLSPEEKILGLSYKRTPEQVDVEGGDMYSKITWLTDDDKLIFVFPKDINEFCKIVNIEPTEELEPQYDNLMERDIFEKDEYYRLSTFVERRLFPTLESKLYRFIQSFSQQKEVERKIDEIFYRDPQELAKYALRGLKEYIPQETQIVDEDEMPFLVVDGDDELYNASTVLKICSQRVDEDDVSELCRNIEGNFGNVGIILYQTSEDVKSILRKEDVVGVPAGNRILWQKVTQDVIKFLAAWGYCLKENIDTNKDRLEENKGAYLHDFEFEKLIKEWVKYLRDKKVGVIVDYKSEGETVTEDMINWRYSLLEYPEKTKISRINDYPLFMGYPKNPAFEKRKSILKNLSKYELVEVDDSLTKYKIIQTDYEAYVCHIYLEKELEGRNIDWNCFICANTNYTSSKFLNHVVLPMLIEKGVMIEREGGYDFRCISESGVLNILDSDFLNETKKIFDDCNTRDEYTVNANDFAQFIIENLKEEEKENAFGDKFIPLFGGVDMAKHWKSHFSWNNLRAKFNEVLEKIEDIKSSKDRYIHKLEELYEESKKPGYNSLKKTKEFISHVSELTAPYHIIESRIYPQAKSFSEALTKLYEKAKEMIKYIHEPASVSIIDKRDVGKNYYKNGQFEQLEKIYIEIKNKRELLEKIKEEGDMAIEECKEKLAEALKQNSELKEQITPEFKISNLIVDNIQESVDTIKIEKRIDTTIKSYKSEEEILEKLGEEKESIDLEITDYQSLLGIIEKIIPIEKQIIEYKDLEEVKGIIEKLDEEAVKEANEHKNKIEEKINEYDTYVVEDMNSKSLSTIKEKLDEIKKAINEEYEVIKRLFEESYSRIERGKELIKNFLDKDEKIPSDRKEQINKKLEEINKDKSINECRDKLQDIFEIIEETTKETDIHVYRILAEESENGEADFKSAVQKVSDDLGLDLEKARSRITKLIENDYVTAIIKF